MLFTSMTIWVICHILHECTNCLYFDYIGYTKSEIMFHNMKKLNSFEIVFLYGINWNVLTLNMHRRIRIFAIGMWIVIKLSETLVCKKLVKVTVLVMLR